MGFSGKCDKYDKRCFSTKTNKNYCFSVDVTKSSLFKKTKALPRAHLMASIVVYICLVAATLEIILQQKEKKTAKKGNSIDLLSNLKINTNLKLVRTYVLAKEKNTSSRQIKTLY